MMSPEFAKTFRAMVLPRLQQRVPICAAMIVTDLSAFSSEVAALSRTAWRLGGSSLDADLWDELEAWIETRVIDAVTRIELRQAVPAAHRDILAVFAEQEQAIADLVDENDRLRSSLAAAWLVAADDQRVSA